MPKVINRAIRRGLVYKITAPNGKGYIGQTVAKLKKRMGDHLRTETHCSILARAIAKYGWEAMTVAVLWEGPANLLDRMERRFIREHRTCGPGGYNATTGGEAKPTMTASVKRKIREAWARPEVREKQKAARVAAWERSDVREARVDGISEARKTEETQAKFEAFHKRQRDAKLLQVPVEKREAEFARLEREKVRMAKARGIKVRVWEYTASWKSHPSCAPGADKAWMEPSDDEE